MPSKSRDVRIEQRRVLEKKLEARLAMLAAQGIAKEKIQKDPLVKNLKSKIKETGARIAAFDKNIQKAQELQAAKAQKLEDAKTGKKKEASPEKETKPKKKAAAAEGATDAAKKSAKKKEGAKAK